MAKEPLFSDIVVMFVPLIDIVEPASIRSFSPDILPEILFCANKVVLNKKRQLINSLDIDWMVAIVS